MDLENIKRIDHNKVKNNLELKEEKIDKNEAHLVYEPIKKDDQFKIDIDILIKEGPRGLKADSKLIFFNSLGKKLKEFALKNEYILDGSSFKDYLNSLSDLFEKFRIRNLKSLFDREDFERILSKDKRKEIIAKAIKKYKSKINY